MQTKIPRQYRKMEIDAMPLEMLRDRLKKLKKRSFNTKVFVSDKTTINGIKSPKSNTGMGLIEKRVILEEDLDDIFKEIMKEW